MTGVARPANSGLYPWYDSVWLEQYSRAKSILADSAPEKLAEFDGAMQVFRTRADFRVRSFDQIFDDATMEQIRSVVTALKPSDFELHEAKQFKRFVVHDHAYFTELHHQLTETISDAAGEALEPNYNFLSLYSSTGVCPVHMDSPEAKWTLDLCVNQTDDWPIHISNLQPWPEANREDSTPLRNSADWQTAIKQARGVQFEAYTMQPGQSILFAGSSQWHYRDAMPASSAKSSCDLLFFHFVPKGSKPLLKPREWAARFGVPALNDAAF